MVASSETGSRFFAEDVLRDTEREFLSNNRALKRVRAVIAYLDDSSIPSGIGPFCLYDSVLVIGLFGFVRNVKENTETG